MADIGIFVGTMYGNALLVAEEAEAILSGLGHKAKVFEDPEVQDWEPYSGKYVLVVTSTTGQGDLPDSIIPLYEGIKDMYQPHLRYGIIALGDSTYANFCGGGKTFDALHIVGGGCRNHVLNQWTADAVGIPVYTEPGECTALGNIMAQLLAHGQWPNVAQARACVGRSFQGKTYLPQKGV